MASKGNMQNNLAFCKVHGCRYKHSHVTTGHTCGTCKKYGHGQVECGNSNLIKKLEQYCEDTLPIQKYCTMKGCIRKEYHTTIAHHCSFRNCGGNHSIHDCPIILNGVCDDLIKIECPICRKDSTIPSTYTKIIGYDTKCIICYTNNVEVLLQCGHANICDTCCRIMNSNISDNVKSESDLDESDLKEIKNKFKNIQGKIYTITSAGMGCSFYSKRNSNTTPITTFFMHCDMWGQYNSCDDRPDLYRFIHGYTEI